MRKTFYLLVFWLIPSLSIWADEEIYTLQVGEEEVHYRQEAGLFPLKDNSGEVIAELSYFAYFRTDSEDTVSRPITFAYNGGPGSSSIWLHLGCLGPKRVLTEEFGGHIAPPYEMVDNAYSMLDQTDLVFLDPVGTGFSRASNGHSDNEFWGVHQDAEAAGDFIRQFVQTHNRWLSPKFICGESYGTTRSAMVAQYLQDNHQLYLNGVILLSQVLDFATLGRGHGGENLSYVLNLPSYAATAWYHNKIDTKRYPDLPSFLKEVTSFAYDEYLPFLMRGGKASETEVKAVCRQLACCTGLTAHYIARHHFTISNHDFFHDLLWNPKKPGELLRVGRFDGRKVGPYMTNPNYSALEEDPSYSSLVGPFAACLNAMISDLDLGEMGEYQILAFMPNICWDWSVATMRALSVTDSILGAMACNSELHLFVGQGYYDLATPFAASDYSLDQIEGEYGISQRTMRTYYEAGHMMYLHPESLVKLKEDLDNFYQKALSR